MKKVIDYHDWRTFVQNVVVPSVQDDNNTPNHPATVEWERQCAEYPSFVQACVYFMWQEITMLERDKKVLLEMLDQAHR